MVSAVRIQTVLSPSFASGASITRIPNSATRSAVLCSVIEGPFPERYDHYIMRLAFPSILHDPNLRVTSHVDREHLGRSPHGQLHVVTRFPHCLDQGCAYVHSVNLQQVHSCLGFVRDDVGGGHCGFPSLCLKTHHFMLWGMGAM